MAQLPAADPTVRSIPEQIADLRRELADLRRRVVLEPKIDPQIDSIHYSHPSGPAEGTPSPPYTYRRASGYLTSVQISAGDPGNAPTTFRVYKKEPGKSATIDLATVEMAEDDSYEMVDDLMEEVEEMDRVFVVCDELGSGLSDVTIVLTFTESVG
jgi:hypothetical protein